MQIVERKKRRDGSEEIRIKNGIISKCVGRETSGSAALENRCSS